MTRPVGFFQVGPTFGLLLLLLSGSVVPPARALEVRTNPLGYLPQGPKRAVLLDVPTGEAADDLRPVLVDPKQKDLLQRDRVVGRAPVVTVHSSNAGAGPQTQDWVLALPSAEKPGQYVLRTSPTETTTVNLSPFIFWDALQPVVRAIYAQRCGSPVADAANSRLMAACHLEDTHLADDADEGSIDAAGGWHDGAGQPTKTVAETAATLAPLLTSYERWPQPFQYFKLDYPPLEQKRGDLPDWLHEARVGLDWLLAMQDTSLGPNRGGVRAQVSGAAEADRQLSAPDPEATAQAAAIWGTASRAYRKKDLGYAIKCLKAAERAWAFLGRPNAPKASPEARLWAAVELYLATGEDTYRTAVQQGLNTTTASDPDTWPLRQATADLLTLAPQKGLPLDGRLLASRRAAILQTAEAARVSPEQWVEPFDLPIAADPVLEQVETLLLAYQLSGRDVYRDSAVLKLGPLLGLNRSGQALLTGGRGLPEGLSGPTRVAYAWTGRSATVIPGVLVDRLTGKRTVEVSGRISRQARLAAVLAGLNAAFNPIQIERGQ